MTYLHSELMVTEDVPMIDSSNPERTASTLTASYLRGRRVLLDETQRRSKVTNLPTRMRKEALSITLGRNKNRDGNLFNDPS